MTVEARAKEIYPPKEEFDFSRTGYTDGWFDINESERNAYIRGAEEQRKIDFSEFESFMLRNWDEFYEIKTDERPMRISFKIQQFREAIKKYSIK